MKVTHRREHPHGALVVVAIEGPPSAEDIARLHPGERDLLKDKKGFRIASWVAGRLAAAEALKAAGGPAASVGTDDRGAPLFPSGWTGSISHKANVAVALVAPDEGWRIGVDVENVAPVRERIRRKILTPAEQARIEPREDRWPAVLATFSVKESIYKALDPFVRRYVGFTEVELDPLPTDLTRPDRVVRVGAQMRLAEGEGPFEVQTTFCWRDDPVSTARVRRAH